MNADVRAFCPFCGIRKEGHALRCHVQACSKRDRETGGKDALDMVGSGRLVGDMDVSVVTPNMVLSVKKGGGA